MEIEKISVNWRAQREAVVMIVWLIFLKKFATWVKGKIHTTWTYIEKSTEEIKGYIYIYILYLAQIKCCESSF